MALWPAAGSSRVRLGVTVSLAAGYDTDLYLGAAGRSEDIAETSGALVQTAPSAALVWGTGDAHQLSVFASGSLRRFLGADSTETAVDHGVALAYRSPALAGGRAEVVASYAHLWLHDATDAGWFLVDGSLSFERPLSDAVAATVGYAVTYYGAVSRVAHELQHRLSFAVRWRAYVGLSLRPSYEFVVGRSEPSTFNAIGHRIGVVAGWSSSHAPLHASARYHFSATDITGSDRGTDLGHQVGAEVSFEITPWLAAFADYTAVVGGDRAEHAYQRHVAMGGVSARLEWTTRAPTAPSPAELRVTVIARGATRVAVVGSFNGWDPTRHPMSSTGSARWQRTLRLSPGTHYYMVWADGRIVRPRDCPEWQADGFGGRNCIVRVPRSH